MTTLLDISKKCGVSESTVSRSLRDDPRISKATREKVRKMAEEMEFDFNAVARSLATKKTSTIGIVYPDFETQFHRSLYLDMLVHDIRRNLESVGYDCLIFEAFDKNNKSNIRRLILQEKVDGFIFVIADILESDWNLLLKKNVPLVQIHSKPVCWGNTDDFNRYDYFFTNNYKGGQLAGQHLLDQNAANFLCLADNIQSHEMLERTAGFSNVLTEHGVKPKNIETLFIQSNFNEACNFIVKNINKIKSYNGIFAHTDIIAIAALHVLQEKGIKVPRDIKIVGYDDIPVCELVFPTLTTIHQPREIQAKLACDRLLKLISTGYSDALQQELLDPHLVKRNST